MREGREAPTTAAAKDLERLLAEFVTGMAALDAAGPGPLGCPGGDLAAPAAPKERLPAAHDPWGAPLDAPRARVTAGASLPAVPSGGVSAFDALAPETCFRAVSDSSFPDLLLDIPVAPARVRSAEPIDARSEIEAYPHAVEGLAALWDDPACDAYLERLVVDSRGHRRGFPPPVMDELLFLVELRLFVPSAGVGR